MSSVFITDYLPLRYRMRILLENLLMVAMFAGIGVASTFVSQNKWWANYFLVISLAIAFTLLSLTLFFLIKIRYVTISFLENQLFVKSWWREYFVDIERNSVFAIESYRGFLFLALPYSSGNVGQRLFRISVTDSQGNRVLLPAIGITDKGKALKLYEDFRKMVPLLVNPEVKFLENTHLFEEGSKSIGDYVIMATLLIQVSSYVLATLSDDSAWGALVFYIVAVLFLAIFSLHKAKKSPIDIKKPNANN